MTNQGDDSFLWNAAWHRKKTAEKGSNEIDEKPLAWQGVALNNELSEKDALRTPCDFNVNSQTL